MKSSKNNKDNDGDDNNELAIEPNNHDTNRHEDGNSDFDVGVEELEEEKKGGKMV